MLICLSVCPFRDFIRYEVIDTDTKGFNTQINLIGTGWLRNNTKVIKDDIISNMLDKGIKIAGLIKDKPYFVDNDYFEYQEYKGSGDVYYLVRELFRFKNYIIVGGNKDITLFNYQTGERIGKIPKIEATKIYKVYIKQDNLIITYRFSSHINSIFDYLGRLSYKISKGNIILISKDIKRVSNDRVIGTHDFPISVNSADEILNILGITSCYFDTTQSYEALGEDKQLFTCFQKERSDIRYLVNSNKVYQIGGYTKEKIIYQKG
jgi:hypothetical protein